MLQKQADHAKVRQAPGFANHQAQGGAVRGFGGDFQHFGQQSFGYAQIGCQQALSIQPRVADHLDRIDAQSSRHVGVFCKGRTANKDIHTRVMSGNVK